MKKFGIQVFLLLIVIFGAMYTLSNPQSVSPFINVPSLLNTQAGVPAKQQIKINNTLINVEVADTAAKRAQGLGGRDTLATGSGMLFVFPEEKVYQFWMKGMKIPIDFIFIDKGKVVDLLPNIPPPQQNQQDNLPIYQPVAAIDMMLEVNSGFISNNQIEVGDTVYQIK